MNSELASCRDWRTWGEMFGISSNAGGFIIDYFIFVSLSVSILCISKALLISQVLFAACASLLVTKYSPYAKQSGIPELKTVLGGFVIRDFLGPWTLIIKSIGLVGLQSEVFYADEIVSCGRFWALAGKRRSSCACGLLLCISLPSGIFLY
jgi:hypothetical protein